MIFLPRVRLNFLVGLLVGLVGLSTSALSGCGSQKCFDDRSCQPGERCLFAAGTTNGTCEPCDPVEIPYDGVDNDCSLGTPDGDVDRDGQTALSVGGLDCDDNDPLVFGGPEARETCDDGKDNDCDGLLDEPDCRDFAPPTAQFTAPPPESVVEGIVRIEATLGDDAGVAYATLSLVAGPTLHRIDFNAPTGTFVFEFDTSTIEDGRHNLMIQVVDVGGRSASAMRAIIVDNMPGPDVVITRPAGTGVSGVVTIEATATDFQGVESMRAFMDGEALAEVNGATLIATVETSTIDGDTHDLRVEAVDTDGNLGVATRMLRVDTVPPVIEFIQPAPRSRLDQPTAVVIRATDPSGVAELRSLSYSTTGGPDSTSLELRFTLQPDELPSGGAQLTAKAVDAAVVDDGTGNAATRGLLFFQERRLLAQGLGQLVAIFPSANGIVVVDETAVRHFDSNGRVVSTFTPGRPITTASFDGVYLGIADRARLTTLEFDLTFVSEATLTRYCASSVTMSGHRFVCGPANDWDRIFTTFDMVSGMQLAESREYTYNGIPMTAVPGYDDFVTVTTFSSPSDFHLYEVEADGTPVFINESPYHGGITATDTFAFDGVPATRLINASGEMLRIRGPRCEIGSSFDSQCFIRDGDVGVIPVGAIYLGMDNDANGKLYTIRNNSSFWPRAPVCTPTEPCIVEIVDVATRTIERTIPYDQDTEWITHLVYDDTSNSLLLGTSPDRFDPQIDYEVRSIPLN